MYQLCLFPTFGEYFQFQGRHFSHVFTEVIWIFNVLQFLLFMLELHWLRKVKCCHLSHAYLMVVLSMTCSIISSTFFLLSQPESSMFFGTGTSHESYIQVICTFGPIVAISFRTLSKSCTWALYIVRGQMVIESLESEFLSKYAMKAPYILVAQGIVMVSAIILFTKTEYSYAVHACSVHYPLWLLVCSALIGELFYGLGFMYIFYKAMSRSMQHVYQSLRPIDAERTKQQIRHHISVYAVQLFISLTFLVAVSLCICFQTLVFFEAELFLSNLCLLSLFRNKYQLLKKALSKCCNPEEGAMHTYLSRDRGGSWNPNRSLRSMASFRQFRNHWQSNYFLGNKWRSGKELTNFKRVLHTPPSAPKGNDKVLELMGVHDTDCGNAVTTQNIPALVGAESDIPPALQHRHSDDIEIVTQPSLPHADTLQSYSQEPLEVVSAPVTPLRNASNRHSMKNAYLHVANASIEQHAKYMQTMLRSASDPTETAITENGHHHTVLTQLPRQSMGAKAVLSTKLKHLQESSMDDEDSKSMHDLRALPSFPKRRSAQTPAGVRHKSQSTTDLTQYVHTNHIAKYRVRAKVNTDLLSQSERLIPEETDEHQQPPKTQQLLKVDEKQHGNRSEQKKYLSTHANHNSYRLSPAIKPNFGASSGSKPTNSASAMQDKSVSSIKVMVSALMGRFKKSTSTVNNSPPAADLKDRTSNINRRTLILEDFASAPAFEHHDSQQMDAGDGPTPQPEMDGAFENLYSESERSNMTDKKADTKEQSKSEQTSWREVANVDDGKRIREHTQSEDACHD